MMVSMAKNTFLYHNFVAVMMNAPPHIGRAVEMLKPMFGRAGIVCFGRGSFFLTGTDEHGEGS